MSTVPLASSYARKLVDEERRASGTDVKLAISAVARRMKRPAGAIWSLLFRPPKDVPAALFLSLSAAVERQIISDIGRLENELAAVRSGARCLAPGALAEAEASLARLKKVLRPEAPQ